MDKLIAELLSTGAAPLIAALNAHEAALNRNSDNLERVLAGQEAAMAKLEGGSSGGTTTRAPRRTAAQKAADEAATAAATTPSTSTPAVGEKPVETKPVTPVHVLLANPNGETKKVTNKEGKEEDAPSANYRAADFSRDQVKNEFIGWLGDTTDKDERAARAAFVGEIGQHFGVKLPFAPTGGLETDEQRKQTLFFLRRKREGLAVNFSADYDFDADPLADQTIDPVVEDEVDPLG